MITLVLLVILLAWFLEVYTRPFWNIWRSLHFAVSGFIFLMPPCGPQFWQWDHKLNGSTVFKLDRLFKTIMFCFLNSSTLHWTHNWFNSRQLWWQPAPVRPATEAELTCRRCPPSPRARHRSRRARPLSMDWRAQWWPRLQVRWLAYFSFSVFLSFSSTSCWTFFNV